MDDVTVKLNSVERQIRDEKEYAKRRDKNWAEQKAFLLPIVCSMDVMEIDCRFTTWSLDIAFTGDKDKLAAVLRTIMSAGYRTKTDKPKAGDTGWSAYFINTDTDRHPIWLSFTSSVCKRVKVGTKMQEVDVYEVQCGEKLEVEQVTPALEDNNG